MIYRLLAPLTAPPCARTTEVINIHYERGERNAKRKRTNPPQKRRATGGVGGSQACVECWDEQRARMLEWSSNRESSPFWEHLNAKQIKQQLFLTRETTCHKYSLFVEETLLDKEREIKRRISFSSDPSFPRDTQHHNHSRKPTHLRQLSRLISPIIFKGLNASGFFLFTRKYLPARFPLSGCT